MDLVSNFIGSISAAQFGGNSERITPFIDINESNFEDMLNKQISKIAEQNTTNPMNNINSISGINIAELNGEMPFFNAQGTTNTEAVKPINNTENSFSDFNNKKDFTASEVVTFYNSIFNSKPTFTQQNSNMGLFNFERKLAANSYDKYAKFVVTNLEEFVSDTMKK